MESFKSAVKQAEKVHPGQPDLATIPNYLGQACIVIHESLRFFQATKEILDDLDYGNLGSLNSSVLNNVGTCCYERGDCFLAFKTFKDAFDDLDPKIISVEFYESLCGNMAATVVQLSIVSGKQAWIQSQIKEYLEAHGEMPLTKDTCPVYVNIFYQLSCIEESDKALGHLEGAKEIAKWFHYKCGRVVLVLLLLSMIYG